MPKFSTIFDMLVTHFPHAPKEHILELMHADSTAKRAVAMEKLCGVAIGSVHITHNACQTVH
jgi:hypothetical protein